MSEELVMAINVVYALKDILLGATGGVIAYLFDYSKAKRAGDKDFPFMPSSMFINMVLGAFVAYCVGTVVAEDTAGRDAIVGLRGVTAYSILLITESKFAEWVINKITSDLKKKETS